MPSAEEVSAGKVGGVVPGTPGSGRVRPGWAPSLASVLPSVRGAVPCGWGWPSASDSAAASGSVDPSGVCELTTLGTAPEASKTKLPSGSTGRPSWISAITACQISAGRPPPVTPFSGLLSSLPSHTPVTYWPVKPMNQASR